MVREAPRGVKILLVSRFRDRYNRRMEETVRPPIVAGVFYPGDPAVLRATIESFFPSGENWRGDTLVAPVGLIAPHAGYPYSGAVAASGYTEVAARGRPEAVVLLGANHTGSGLPIAVTPHTVWETPLGRSPIERELVAQLVERGIPRADAPFTREHSIEVQIPFLQAIWGNDLPIVPICVLSGSKLSAGAAIDVIAGAIGDRSVLIVASSDFTHYESDATARDLDRQALEPILTLDAKAFERLCRERGLSICGTGAIRVLLGLCHRLGLTQGSLIDYATSGDVTGNREAVVGYASVLFTRGDG